MNSPQPDTAEPSASADRGAKPGALEADSLRQSGSEAYGGRCVIPSEGCTERRNAKAGNYDDSVDGHDGTKGENRNPGAGPEGASPDQFALELGEPAEHRQYRPAVRRRGVRPRVAEDLNVPPALAIWHFEMHYGRQASASAAAPLSPVRQTPSAGTGGRAAPRAGGAPAFF